ncbi:MAG: hypothetical protein WD845_07970 [Pirellulales bacterium]
MRVISVTPAGRRRYLAALVPHLLRQRHIIDEHHWWLNTTDADDIRYVEQVTAEHPKFFKIRRKEVRPDLQLGENIWRYFRDYARPNTLYIRFDDDILYVADDAVDNLVRYRLAHREPLLVLGNIINNAVCTHFHQQAGLVPWHWGEVRNECMDHNGWWRGEFARRLHALVLDELRHDGLERWKQVALPVEGTRRFSINVISWLGDDLAGVPELAQDRIDEEPFLTETLPSRLGRPTVACPAALFVHFAFYPQRPLLEWTWPELVGHYQALAEQEGYQPRSTETVLRLVRDTAWLMGKSAGKVRAHARKHWWPREAA